MEQFNTEQVNDRQVGGEHYRSPYQHWDWVIDHDIPYVIGCATKYIIRWRKKNGAEDVQKAIHYVEKYIASGCKNFFNHDFFLRDGCAATHRFIAANNIEREDEMALWGILNLFQYDESESERAATMGRLNDLLQTAQKAAGGRGATA
jgi:hypothetical protein